MKPGRKHDLDPTTLAGLAGSPLPALQQTIHCPTKFNLEPGTPPTHLEPQMINLLAPHLFEHIQDLEKWVSQASRPQSEDGDCHLKMAKLGVAVG